MRIGPDAPAPVGAAPRGSPLQPRARLLLLVAPPDAVAGACRAAQEYLTFVSRVSSDRDRRPDRVLGVWSDGPLVEVVPDVLDCACRSARSTIRIRESVGVSGCWSLYWLDVDGGDATPGVGDVREELVAALMAVSARRGSAPPQFVPVSLPLYESPEVARAGSRRLMKRFPGVIREPVLWNTATGSAGDVPRPDRGGRS